jgi:photosystem II stability/assembly factor-like uncharacterized protein
VPIWVSTDLNGWTRATSADHSAQLVNPLSSASVNGLGYIAAVSPSADGRDNKLVYSMDGGLTWKIVKPTADTSPYLATASSVATFSTYDGNHVAYDMVFVSTSMADGGHIYMSVDHGLTWSRVIDQGVGGPNGYYLLEISDGYTVGSKKILAYSDPGSGLGVWLASLDSATP